VSALVQCRDRTINQQLVESHLDLYHAMKQPNKNDLKDLEISNFELLFKILKDLVLGDNELQ
jgi:hypothetical protein